MRLRLVVPPDVDEPTGGNVYDLRLAAALRAAGDEIRTVRCDPSGLPGLLGRDWDGPTLVDGLLACRHPDAVATWRPAVLVHMPLAWETGLHHDHVEHLDRLERGALRAASVVITTSRWSARYVEGHHALSAVVVAPPGVDPAPVGSGSAPPLFVHLAALVPHKDQLGVVAALARVRDLPWRARLAGSVDRDTAYAAAVRDAVRDAGLSDRVHLPGTMRREDAWAGADLALLPSRVESFGMVVTEALARGVPAVVSDGGPAEALGTTANGERPGVVVPAADTAALAAALRRWLTDAAHRQTLKAAALSRRATLEGWDVTAHRVRTVLARV